MAPELGVIEGYFGRPWQHVDRKQVMSRLRELGYAFFHFAPKANAFVRRRWREPHPDATFAELVDLSAHCQGLGLRFGVGLSPYELYRDFSGADKAAFIAKVRLLDQIGIDDLAVLFDDTRGDVPDLAAREAEIVHIALEHTRASRVFMCPTYYADDHMLDVVFGERPAGYLRDLGRRLDPQVAAHAINPALQPHLSLIPAATLVASYREGSAYRDMHAFREAAHALAGADIAAMLEQDLHALQDRGFDQLGDDRERLRQRYAAVDHPLAAEVVRWLDGADTVDGWVEQA
jgi:beta-N-acetylglucosaminidase